MQSSFPKRMRRHATTAIFIDGRGASSRVEPSSYATTVYARRRRTDGGTDGEDWTTPKRRGVRSFVVGSHASEHVGGSKKWRHITRVTSEVGNAITHGDKVGHQFAFHRQSLKRGRKRQQALCGDSGDNAGSSKTNPNQATHRYTARPELIWSCQKKLGRASDPTTETDRPACLPAFPSLPFCARFPSLQRPLKSCRQTASEQGREGASER